MGKMGKMGKMANRLVFLTDSIDLRVILYNIYTKMALFIRLKKDFRYEH